MLTFKYADRKIKGWHITLKHSTIFHASLHLQLITFEGNRYERVSDRQNMRKLEGEQVHNEVDNGANYL